MDPKLIAPVLIAVFVAFVLYRRVRRNIGRQRVSPVRMQWRMGIFGVIGALMLLASLRDMNLFGAMVAGLAGGLALGWFGLRHTKFENTPEGNFYTPHTYIGLFVSALLLGRVLYRFVVVYPAMHAAAQDNANPFAAYQKSPLTLAILGIVIGYYLAYYAGVLIESRRLAAVSAPRKD
ncbi:MAG: DUF1453 domain-containing protein [Rudaea sp.]|nr:DUF1453 domain-containing protein [Rudaea sp.]